MIGIEEVRARLAGSDPVALPRFGRQEAAVLVPLLVEESGLKLLLTRRSASLPHHPGEISFPGGVVEAGDADSYAAAVREAREEVGLRPEACERLGTLDDLFTVTGFRVRPHVVLVRGPLELVIDGAEVAHALAIPLEFFRAPGQGYRLSVEGAGGERHSFPVYNFEGNVIWGATARMIAGLLGLLFPREEGGGTAAALERVLRRVLAARKVVLTTHLNPDPDGLGCEVALEEMLLALGKEVLIANHEPVPARFGFIAFRSRVVTGKQITEATGEDADLLIVVDTAEAQRTGSAARLIPRFAGRTVVLDHHLDGDMKHDCAIIDRTFATASELVYLLLQRAGFPLTRRAAEALYAGILFDTNGFRYVNNRANPFKVAAHLVEAGADATAIQEALFGTMSMGQVKAIKLAMERAAFEFDGRWAWAQVDDGELNAIRATTEDAGEIAPYLVSIEGVCVAAVFRVLGNGQIKLSLRSKKGWPIGHICKAFGGGGHANAGGATFTSKVEDAVPRVRAMVEELLRSA